MAADAEVDELQRQLADEQRRREAAERERDGGHQRIQVLEAELARLAWRDRTTDAHLAQGNTLPNPRDRLLRGLALQMTRALSVQAPSARGVQFALRLLE